MNLTLGLKRSFPTSEPEIVILYQQIVVEGIDVEEKLWLFPTSVIVAVCVPQAEECSGHKAFPPTA